MDIKKMLASINDRVFGKEIEEMICAIYHEETDFPFHEIEADYKKAMEALGSASPEQQDLLAQIEHDYSETRTYAIHYCIPCGLFAGYRQCFVEADTGEDDFNQLVEESLFTMPGMQRHTAYFDRREECHKKMQKLEESLPKSAAEHIVSLECAWDERVHHAGLVAFYLGYRMALDFIGNVSLSAMLEMVRKQLATEYHLGLIGTYDQNMRKQDTREHKEK